MSRGGLHNEDVINFYIKAKIHEICAFNNIAQRLKSGLRSSLKVRLRFLNLDLDLELNQGIEVAVWSILDHNVMVHLHRAIAPIGVMLCASVKNIDLIQ